LVTEIVALLEFFEYLQDRRRAGRDRRIVFNVKDGDGGLSADAAKVATVS